jgi:large subunit ribosomal protein L19
MIKTVDFSVGDLVRVHERIKEGNKSRIQVFEGTVLGFKGREDNRSFRVMKISAGVGVEKIFPVKSVNLEKVVVKEKPKKRVRRAKLYNKRIPKA